MSKPIFSCSRFEKILSLLHGYNVPHLCENFIVSVCLFLLSFLLWRFSFYYLVSNYHSFLNSPIFDHVGFCHYHWKSVEELQVDSLGTEAGLVVWAWVMLSVT